MEQVQGSSRPRVLVVEDEEPLARLVTRYLQHAQLEAEFVVDGAVVLDRVQEWSPDVLVLDLGLPGMDGFEVCRRVREVSDCYVIILTARAEERDRLAGLAIGADDYMTKPFSPRELVARVRVVLRRPRSTAPVEEPPSPLVVGGLRIDTVGREAQLEDVVLELTRTEFALLATLAADPGVAYSRASLIRAVWGPGWVGDDRLVDVHVANLRRKLGDAATSPAFIRTVRGVGYRMEPGR